MWHIMTYFKVCLAVGVAGVSSDQILSQMMPNYFPSFAETPYMRRKGGRAGGPLERESQGLENRERQNSKHNHAGRSYEI